jgi:hypothetical protein
MQAASSDKLPSTWDRPVGSPGAGVELVEGTWKVTVPFCLVKWKSK